MKTLFLKITVFVVLLLLLNYSFAQDKNKTEILTIKTSSVCGTCKYNIEKSLVLERGVKSASLNIENKIATVIYKPSKTSPDKIRKAISAAGYDADDIKADAKAYANLAPCCKKEYKGEHSD
jgi:mercuric ion binding protein